MNPEPPPITIVDPNAPPGTPDLIDSGRDPWRPSRRQAVVGTVVVLLLALVAGLAAQVRHVRHESALDRQSVRGVRLLVNVSEPDLSASGDVPAGSVLLNVLNDGRGLVRLRSVRIDSRAEVPVETGSDLIPGALTTVPMPMSGSCAADAGRAQHTLTFRLRTDRGQAVTTTQPLLDDLVNQHERERCGTQTPIEALASAIVSATRRGRWVDVVLDLRNTSVLPLTVTSLTAPQGLVAQLPPLPVVLAPATAPHGTGPSRQLRLSLQVSSCDAYNTGLMRAEQFETSLAAGLHGRYEDEQFHILLAPSFETGFGLDAPDPQQVLMSFCPSYFFG
jgi:hypothetical protein